MAQSLACEPFQLSQGRSFWTTQPDACGTSSLCSTIQCAAPGLATIVGDDGVSFSSNDAVRSLALNMLLTDARKRDTRCGHLPGTMNGHWSESFANGIAVGSHVREVTTQKTINDSVNLLKAEVQATLQKLVDYGIAVEVQVDAKYQGSGIVGMEITIYGTAVDPTRIGMTAKRDANQWVWGI
jgi:phage gp46-like protein